MTTGKIPAGLARPGAIELPQPLRAILDDLDKSDREARRIVESASDTQANWRPSETSWSIAQCIDHLARSNHAYSTALLEAIRASTAAEHPFQAPIRTGLISGPFIRSLEPPPRGKIKAPRSVLPAPAVPRDEALRAFLRSHDGLRAVLHEGAFVDWNRTRFRNPFFWFLRFTVGAGLLIIVAHDRRHLWQAEQVRRAENFPD